MPIVLRCDHCNEIIDTVETIGISGTSNATAHNEQTCTNCNLTTLMGSWAAVFQELRQRFIADSIPEQKLSLDGNLRKRFKSMAKKAAMNHFGLAFDAACADYQIDQQVTDMVDNAVITITIDISGGGQ